VDGNGLQGWGEEQVEVLEGIGADQDHLVASVNASRLSGAHDAACICLPGVSIAGDAGFGRRMLAVPRSRRRTSATSTRDLHVPYNREPHTLPRGTRHYNTRRISSTPMRPLGGVLAK
jgi:hypothetical protein